MIVFFGAIIDDHQFVQTAAFDQTTREYNDETIYNHRT